MRPARHRAGVTIQGTPAWFGPPVGMRPVMAASLMLSAPGDDSRGPRRTRSFEQRLEQPDGAGSDGEADQAGQ